MEYGGPGFDIVREHFVDQLIVESEPFLIETSRAVGDDSWPGKRETVGFDTDLTHEVDVFFKAVVVVAGDVAGV